jgi:hypothetical protein
MGYQKELDRILARHENKWSSLMRSPEDRRRCEAILRKWKDEEARLAGTLPTASRRGPPDALRPGSKEDEELDASDIDD